MSPINRSLCMWHALSIVYINNGQSRNWIPMWSSPKRTHTHIHTYIHVCIVILADGMRCSLTALCHTLNYVRLLLYHKLFVRNAIGMRIYFSGIFGMYTFWYIQLLVEMLNMFVVLYCERGACFVYVMHLVNDLLKQKHTHTHKWSIFIINYCHNKSHNQFMILTLYERKILKGDTEIQLKSYSQSNSFLTTTRHILARIRFNEIKCVFTNCIRMRMYRHCKLIELQNWIWCSTIATNHCKC